MQKPEITAYLGIGSNLGDKKGNIKKALIMLQRNPDIKLINHSSVYLTEPFGVSRQPDFYNCAVMIKTMLPPHSLLSSIQIIEYDMGREPNSHLQPRPIDIDILLYGELGLDSLDLMIPHSRLTKRSFVLVPLLEITPDLVHPMSFRLLKEYLVEIDPPQKIERIIDAGELFRTAKED